MSNLQIMQEHDKYLKMIYSFDDKDNEEYKKVYHKWFVLREAGERRGLWLFTPSNKEINKILKEGNK